MSKKEKKSEVLVAFETNMITLAKQYEIFDENDSIEQTCYKLSQYWKYNFSFKDAYWKIYERWTQMPTEYEE